MASRLMTRSCPERESSTVKALNYSSLGADQRCFSICPRYSVTLYLPKKRTLTSLSVRLLGRQDISFGDLRAPESEVSLSKTVGLFESEAMEFDKGETRFAFSIIVPSSTPSYERCQHGRVAHTVTAKAKSRGQVGDLRASVGVMLVPNPGGAGSSAPPPGFFHRYEGAAERFGRYSISLQSHHIMVRQLSALRLPSHSQATCAQVGGLMLLRTRFEPIRDVTIHAIRVRLHQHFHVTSPTNAKRTATLPTDKRTIIALDGGSPPNFGIHESLPKGKTSSGIPLVRLSSGQPYQMHHLARLLNHDDLRPTTFAHSRSAIRIRHDIIVEVVYSEDQLPKMKQTGAELKTLTMTRGLELYSVS